MKKLSKKKQLTDKEANPAPKEAAKPAELVPTVVNENTPNLAVNVKHSSGVNWILLAIALLLVATGVLGVVWWSNTPTANPYYGLLAVMIIMASGPVGWVAFRSRGTGYTKRDKKKENANSFNIYHDKLSFELVENATGQLRLCRNDGQYYHVHIEDVEKKCLKAFVLPDAQYRDPREFANNVNIPCHRRLAKGTTSMMQKIAPFALVAGMGIMAFLFITFEGRG